MTKTDKLAHDITRRNSLLTYGIINLFADRSLVNGCFKAYAYFRWLDDEVDENLKSSKARHSFIKRQKSIITSSYAGEKVKRLSPEEKMVVDLIFSDDRTNPRLESFIRKFFSIVEYDANRKGKRINQKDLKWYSTTLGQATTDCMQYFIGNKCNYCDSSYKYSGAIAAHIVHMFRDYEIDQELGYHNFDLNSPQAIDLLKLARKYFIQSRKYIKNLPSLRLRLASYLYILRFEKTLLEVERKYL